MNDVERCISEWVDRNAALQAALDAERGAKEAYQSTVVDLRKELATLQAQLRQVVGERDILRRQVDNQVRTIQRDQSLRDERDEQGQLKAGLCKRLDELELAYIKLERQRSDLEKWLDEVTLALQRPGGARFEDVPGHIKTLVGELATLKALVRKLPVCERPLHVQKDSLYKSSFCVKMVGIGDEMSITGTPELVKGLAALLRYRAALTPAARETKP